MSTPITTWDTNRRWVRTWVRRGDGPQARDEQPHWGRNSELPSRTHRHTGVLGDCRRWGLGGGGTFPSQLLRSYAPQSQASTSLFSPNLMPHRVPEDGQEGPLEKDAELCKGAGGKGVAFNGIHFLGRGHWLR